MAKKIHELYDPPKSRTSFSEGHKSKGILDDHAVRQNIATKEGTVEKVPINNSDIANKVYVDTLTTDHPHQDVNTTATPTFNGLISTGEIHLNSVGANIIKASNANGDLRLGAGGGSNDLQIDINGNVEIFENLTLGTNKILKVDHIDEKTANHDVDFDVSEVHITNGFLRCNVNNSRLALTVSRAGVTFLGVVPYINDGVHWAMRKDTFAGSHNTIFTSFNNMEIDHDHEGQSPDPTCFFHSVTNPNTDNTQWGSLTHNRTDFVLNTGKGDFRIKDKIKLTALGGYAIKLTNKTGSNTVQGQLVAVYSATAVDDAFATQVASGDNTIGIVLDAGVSDGSEAWVVVSGIADVLIDAGGSARGDRIISSATAGSGDVWNVGGAVATHFLEIGHCIETRGGAGLARCVLHFN